MSPLLAKIDAFGSRCERHLPHAVSELWVAWWESQELKVRLFEAHSGTTAPDDLLLGRQRLNSGRERVKRALLRAVASGLFLAEETTEAAPIASDAPNSSASPTATSEFPVFTASEGVTPELLRLEALDGLRKGVVRLAGGLAEREAGPDAPTIVAAESVEFFLTLATFGGSDPRPAERVEGRGEPELLERLIEIRRRVGHLLRGNLVDEPEDARPPASPLQRLWAADLEDRIQLIHELPLAWAAVREALQVQMVGADGAVFDAATLPTLTARIDWLRREFTSGDVPRLCALDAERALFARRLAAYCVVAREALSTEDKAAGALPLGEAWRLMHLGALLAIEGETLVEEMTRWEGAGPATALGASLGEQRALTEGLRAIVRGRLREADFEALNAFRRQLVLRCDDTLSQASLHADGWGLQNLRDARHDLSWFESEWARRLGHRAGAVEAAGSIDATLEETIDAGGEADDIERNRERHARLQRMRLDVRNEHRERLLQARLHRWLTRPGARALEVVVNVLIVVILGLLYLQIAHGGEIDVEAEFRRQSGRPARLEETRADWHKGKVLLWWHEGEIAEPYYRWMEFTVDPLICFVFLFEFFLKMLLAESWTWYFRKRWFTDLLPSIPFGRLLHTAHANYLIALRSVRLLRLLRASSRVLRLVSLLQRVVDRLVRKFRGLIDIHILLFVDDEAEGRAVSPVPSEIPREERVVTSAFRQIQRMMAREPEGTSAVWEGESAILRAEVAQLAPEGLLSLPRSHHTRRRAVRLESLVEEMKNLDVLQIESALGRSGVVQVDRSLHLIWPVLRLVLGVSRRPPAQAPAETIKHVALALANRLETVYDKGVNFVRDLYGIVSVAEFLSFVGGFFSRVFKRQRNRLFIGVVIVVVSLAMIQIAHRFDVYSLSVEVPFATPDDARAAQSAVSLDCRDEPVAARFATSVDERGAVLGIRLEIPLAHEEKLLDPARGKLDPVALDYYRREQLAADWSRRLTRLLANGPVAIAPESVERRDAFLGKLGAALRNSFGAVLLTVGAIGLLFVWFGNWLMSRAGQVVDEHQRVAEAHYINLLKDYKRRQVSHDLAMLCGRVLRPELLIGDVLEGDEDVRIAARLRQRLEAVAGLSDHAPELVDEPGERDLLIDRILLLYRDYLDGAVLHRSDVKTTEQLLGNLTVRDVMRRLRLTPADYRKLERLDLSRGRSLFGPYVWFLFITNSICQKVGRIVIEMNDRYGTDEFTALHVLGLDPAREAALARVYGASIVEELRTARRDLIRGVFGTYPLAPLSINVFRGYRERYEGGVNIFKVPLHAALFCLRSIVAVPTQFVRMIRDFLHPENATPPPSPRAGLAIAFRKISRMRRPAFMAALDLRSRFDLAYLDIPIPGCDLAGCEGSTCSEDLELIDASPAEEARLAARRDEYALRLRDFERVRRAHRADIGDLKRDPMRLRAAASEFVFDPDLADLFAAQKFLDERWPELVRTGGWPGKSRWRERLSWNLAGWWATRPRLRRPSDVARFLKARRHAMPRDEQPARAAREALRRAWWFDVDRARRLLEVCVRHKATVAPRRRAIRLLQTAAAEANRFGKQLSTVRTIQTLSVLDLMNYRRLVALLGEYDRPHEEAVEAPSPPAPKGGDAEPPLMPIRPAAAQTLQ